LANNNDSRTGRTTTQGQQQPASDDASVEIGIRQKPLAFIFKRIPSSFIGMILLRYSKISHGRCFVGPDRSCARGIHFAREFRPVSSIIVNISKTGGGDDPKSPTGGNDQHSYDFVAGWIMHHD
jgi:hypothetical protein